MAFFKKLFNRPMPSADLLRRSEENIKNPPLPKEWRDLAASLVGKSGGSNLDFWRTDYKSTLNEIAAEPTWNLQRMKLIARILDWEGWRATRTASNDVKFVDAWKHLVENNDAFNRAPKENWNALLSQIWLHALLSSACLMELGQQLYAIDNVKQNEIGLHYEYEKEIKTLDVRSIEQMLKYVESYEDDNALALGDLKDEVLNPLIREQYRILALMREDIVNGNIDPQEIQRQMQILDEKRRSIATGLVQRR
jgi:hypothetical protein